MSEDNAKHRLNVLVLGSSLYVGTGILQPMVIDWLRIHHALGRHGLLLPTWTTTMGMAGCGLLANSKDWREARLHVKLHDDVRRRLLLTAAVDVVSGMLLSGGLMWTGGSIFVVLYNSVPVWTALQARCGLGQVLNKGQIVGVLLVSIGLASQVWSSSSSSSPSGGGNNADSSTTNSSSTLQNDNTNTHNNNKVMIGSVMVLLGSFLHGTMFILTEATLTSPTGQRVLSSQIWCSMMGQSEASFMTIWIVLGVALWGFNDPNELSDDIASKPFDVVCGLTMLVVVNLVHAAAFFALLQHLGAVGSALLKGGQTVAVVLLSALFFCHGEPHQCLTKTKTFSLVLVLSGMMLYARSKNSNSKENDLKKNSVSNKGALGQDMTDLDSLLR